MKFQPTKAIKSHSFSLEAENPQKFDLNNWLLSSN